MKPEQIIEYIQDVFRDGYEFKSAMHDGKTFTFTSGEICTLKGGDKIFIQWEEFPIMAPEATLRIDLARCTSEVFKKHGDDSTLNAVVRITLDSSPATIFEKAGVVWDDVGDIQISESGYSDHLAEIEGTAEWPDAMEFTEALSGHKVKGVSYKCGVFRHGYSQITLDNFSAVNIIAGYGRGEYPVYYGFNKDKKLSVIYIDFRLFDRPEIIKK